MIQENDRDPLGEPEGANASPRSVPSEPGHPPRHWFIRKDGIVTGPHPEHLITSFLILGRLAPTQEISLDGQTWSTVLEYPELLPEALQHPEDPASHESLLRDRLREDERVGGRRRRDEGAPGSEDRRRGERRAPETLSIRVARRLRLEQWRRWHRPHEPVSRILRWTLLAAPLLAAAALFLTSLEPPDTTGFPPRDCLAAPAPGVNWSHCDLSRRDLRSSRLDGGNLRNANLQGSDLRGASLRGVDFSFADLRSARMDRSRLDGAILRGANLRGVTLLNAGLADADLRDADLRDARIAGANLSGARLDRAYWVDGRRCTEASVGTCR